MTAHSPEQPIGRDDLVDFLSHAERPDPASHLIGTELEKFGVSLAGGDDAIAPINYPDHVRAVLDALHQRFGWGLGPTRGTNGEIVELVRGGASITLEPGGQLELSGKPLTNVHETCAEFTQHYRELDTISQELRLVWLATGFHPWATRDEISWMPKDRYRIMRAYLPTRGSMALDMMLRTCTVQANFDYASERQCGERLRLSSAIAPIVAAIFANSPFVEGNPSGLQSKRCQVWTDVDPDRCGIPPFFFGGSEFSYEQYVDWALSIPMFFIVRQGRYIPHHETFATFLADGLRTDDGAQHRATWADWTLHLSTVFPEVRLKPYIEFRSADAVGSRFVCALPALLKGVLYDEEAGAYAWEPLADLDAAARRDLWTRAYTLGLHDPQIHGLAKRLVALARAGLERANVRDDHGRNEARFLNRLQERVEAGRTPADEALDRVAATGATGTSPAAKRAFVEAFHFAGVFG